MIPSLVSWIIVNQRITQKKVTVTLCMTTFTAFPAVWNYGTALPSFKEVKKGERNLSVSTCDDLISLIFYPYTDISLISELIKVLHRTNIVVKHQEQLQKGFLSTLEDTRALALLTDERRQDSDRDKLVLGLSLLQIDSKAAEKAVDKSFSALNYKPLTLLIGDRLSKKDFAGNEASAYYLGPSYTATDYINDLVLSEEAYDRIFEEVRNSAAELRVTSVLMSFEEEGTKLAELAFSKMIRELFQEDTPLLSIVNLAAKSLDEDDLLLSEERPLKKIFAKIAERIDVPWQARERRVESCKKSGIPDNEALAEKIISQVWSGPDPNSSTNKLSQDKNTSARKQLVKAFGSLIVVALAYILPRKSNAMVWGPNLARIRDEKGGVPYKGLSKTASLSSVQLNRTQPQTNPVLRQSTVASAQKKDLDAQKQVFLKTLKTEKDEKRFDDIYFHGTFNKTTNEITMEASCGPAHRLEQLRKGPVAKVALEMGCTVRAVELDHHLSSRIRQGLCHFTERTSIVEAISPGIHRLITAQGVDTYELPEGIVSADCYLNQILTKRIEVFESSEGQAIMTK